MINISCIYHTNYKTFISDVIKPSGNISQKKNFKTFWVISVNKKTYLYKSQSNIGLLLQGLIALNGVGGSSERDWRAEQSEGLFCKIIICRVIEGSFYFAQRNSHALLQNKFHFEEKSITAWFLPVHFIMFQELRRTNSTNSVVRAPKQDLKENI